MSMTEMLEDVFGDDLPYLDNITDTPIFSELVAEQWYAEGTVPSNMDERYKKAIDAFGKRNGDPFTSRPSSIETHLSLTEWLGFKRSPKPHR